MDLEARPYRAFIAIADTGSFRRAADLLHVSQPALSAQIKEFERRLGFSLFDRSNRKVVMTVEGKLFIDRARRLVTETEWANNAAREIELNQLRIGSAHHTAEIAERNGLIDGFMRHAPDVPMRILRRSPAQLMDDLRTGDIDLAIMLVAAEGWVSSGVLAGEIEWLTLASRPIALWAPKEHPLAHLPLINEGRLRDLPIAMIDRSHGVAIAETVGRLLHTSGASARIMPEGDAASIARLCGNLRVLGVNLGWYSQPNRDIQSCRVSDWSAVTRLVVAYHSSSLRDRAAHFVDYCRRHVDA